ncbi:MAG: hypothetical protein GY816_01615 [Cytophagales bacterium]|nr:hypothetical protein [Cytophagales bacterium]
MKRRLNPDTKHGKHRTVECPKCGKNFRSNNLNRHMLTHNTTIECAICDKGIRPDKLNKHMLTHKNKKACSYCKKNIREDKLAAHELLCKSKVDETLCNRYTGVFQHLDTDESCSSVFGFFQSIKLNVEESADYNQILTDTCQAARTKLSTYVQKHPVKAQIVVALSFYKEIHGETVKCDKVFRSICEPIMVGDELTDFFHRVKIHIRYGIEQYVRFGSGWIFDRLHSAHLEIAKYSPLS